MEDYVNFINKKFEDYFLDYIKKKNIHPIIEDLYKDVLKFGKAGNNYYDNSNKKMKMNISKLKKLEKYKIRLTKRKIISIKIIKDKYFKDNNYYNFNINNEKLEEIAKYFQNSYMPGTIKKLSDHKYESDKVNVVIYGSGPVGLFIALYINQYYNYKNLSKKKNWNILLIDNRTDKDGYRFNYSRTRQYSIGSSFFSFIIQKLYCNIDYGILINRLEYLLYMYLLVHKFYTDSLKETDNANINLYFSSKNVDLNKIKADIIFDCTGGRMNPKIWSNEDMKGFIPEDMLTHKDSEFTLRKDINKYIWDSDIYPFKNYLVMNDLSNVGYYSLRNQKILDETKKIINKYGTTIDYKTMIQIIEDYKDNKNKKIELLIKYMYHNFIENKSYALSVDIFSVYIQHAIKISKIIKVKDNHRAIYIGAGDTIYHSHFATGAGLSKSIDLSVMCINSLEYFFNR